MQTYQRKADLPRGAAKAIGDKIAEKGEAYQRGDIMEKGVPLYRFVRATRSGCRIRISVEHGGFAKGWDIVSLSRIRGVWKLAD